MKKAKRVVTMKNQKWCWIATEHTPKRYRLALDCGRKYNLVGFLGTAGAVNLVVGDQPMVIVHRKDSICPDCRRPLSDDPIAGCHRGNHEAG